MEPDSVTTDGGAAAPRAGVLRTAGNYADRAVDVLVSAALLIALGVVFFNMLARSFISRPIDSVSELTSLALTVLAFVGGAAAYRSGRHLAMRALVNVVSPAAQACLGALSDYLVLAISVLIVIGSISDMLGVASSVSPELGISQAWFVLPEALGMALIAVYALGNLLARPRRYTARVGMGVGLVAIGLSGVLISGLLLPSANSPTWAGATVILLFVLIAIGVPIAFSLVLGTGIYLYSQAGLTPLAVIPQQTQGALTNFVLVALPFFCLAGLILARGGLSTRIIAFLDKVVGRFAGGLLHVVVLSMLLVSGMSGAKTADVVAVGTPLADELKDKRYDLAETAAVLSTSAAIGELVPPSIAMLVLGTITTLSIGSLFVAGLVPAVGMSVVLMAVVYVRAKYFASCSKAVLPGKPGVRETLLAGAGAMPALGIIIVIFGGILSGIGTPTEVSSVAVVYGFALCALYRRLTLRTFWTLTSDAAILSGIVLFIVANAQAFSWFLTVAGIPQDLLGLMARLPVWVFILVTIASMIVFGSILEGLPALLIFAPVLVPIAAGFGLAPLNYGIVLLAAMGIGAFLPPIGVGYYVACLVCKVPPESAVAKMLPYAAVVVASIIILAFVPWFSLAIPQAFHMAGAG